MFARKRFHPNAICGQSSLSKSRFALISPISLSKIPSHNFPGLTVYALKIVHDECAVQLTATFCPTVLPSESNDRKFDL